MRSATSATRGRNESGRRSSEKASHGRKFALDRFRLRPIVRRLRARLVARFVVRQPPPRPQLGESRRVHHRRRFGQFTEPLEGAARVPPVGNVTLRRQARKLHDADGSRHAQQSRRNRRRVLPARFVIVGKDDDMPAPEVIRPSRVQRDCCRTRPDCRTPPVPILQGCERPFRLREDRPRSALSNFGRWIRNPLDTIQIPDPYRRSHRACIG